MLVDESVSNFLDELGRGDAVPGGGAACAMAAAMAAGLFNMTVRITREREKDKIEALEAAETRVHALAQQLAACVDRDARAYQRVRDAFRMPKEAEDERVKRSMEIQLANREATAVPLEVASLCVDLLEASTEIVRLARPSCISDAGVGNFLALSSVMGALLNVQVNLQSIDDDEFVQTASTRATELFEKSQQRFEEIRQEVMRRLSQP